MTETIICDSTYEGEGAGTSFSAARGTMDSYDGNGDGVGQIRLALTSFVVWRLFLRFPTSTLSLPAGATISSVKLRMVATSKGATTDFDVYILAGGATPPSETNWDAALTITPTYTWRNTAFMSLNTQYLSDELPTGINLGGNTYYTLIASIDRSLSSSSGYIGIGRPYNATEAYRPALVIEYSLPSSNLPIIWWS